MEALKTWLIESLSDADPGALTALGFVVLVVFLSVYTIRHWAKRRKALKEMMPKLGFTEIEEPDPARLVPELLFHPNEFQQKDSGLIQDLIPRVTLAWSGRLAGRDVTVMDVSISRLNSAQRQDTERDFKVNRTVLRCTTPSGEPPPDFVIEEKVMFKGRVKHHRTVRGVTSSDKATFGEHYFLFSDASDDWLERWITPAVETVLSRHRLWTLAAHDGVLYLGRGTKREEPHEMESFVREGEEFLRALLPENGL